jgi:hypothetical protein
MSTQTPFTEQEISTLRELVLRGEEVTEVDLSQVSLRPVTELRQIIRRHSSLFSDPSTPISVLLSAINDRRQAPPPLELPTAIPPKFRGKTAPTPTSPRPPVSNAHLRSIPIRPRYAASAASGPRVRSDDPPPGIGSLAALLYPDLGPAQVCRVLGRTMHNDVECYLVSFFQADQSPCYVPGEYLFRLEPRVGFPLRDEEKFDAHVRGNAVSTDWLLEMIFSAAQNVAVDDANILFPVEQVRASAVKPTPQQIQQLMFQCVSCAALLIICHLAGKWVIPKDKLEKILTTILKTNPAKFSSTQAIMAQIEEKLIALLLRS